MILSILVPSPPIILLCTILIITYKVFLRSIREGISKGIRNPLSIEILILILITIAIEITIILN